MTTLQILKAARELISEPERWTKDAEARSPIGRSVRHESPNACRWCVLAAIWRAGGPPPPSGYGTGAIGALLDAGGFGDSISLLDYNDDPNTTHADILALYDRAIALEEARP